MTALSHLTTAAHVTRRHSKQILINSNRTVHDSPRYIPYMVTRVGTGSALTRPYKPKPKTKPDHVWYNGTYPYCACIQLSWGCTFRLSNKFSPVVAEAAVFLLRVKNRRRNGNVYVIFWLFFNTKNTKLLIKMHTLFFHFDSSWCELSKYHFKSIHRIWKSSIFASKLPQNFEV